MSVTAAATNTMNAVGRLPEAHSTPKMGTSAMRSMVRTVAKVPRAGATKVVQSGNLKVERTGPVLLWTFDFCLLTSFWALAHAHAQGLKPALPPGALAVVGIVAVRH